MCGPEIISAAKASPFGYDVTTVNGQSGNVPNDPAHRHYAAVQQFLATQNPAPVTPPGQSMAPPAPKPQSSGPELGGKDSAVGDTIANAVRTIGGGRPSTIVKGEIGGNRLGGVQVTNQQSNRLFEKGR